MSKVIYFDTETTGLDPVKNDIIQLACIIEIDNQVVDEFEFKIKPFDFQNISQEALDVHGYTLEMLREFPGPDIILTSLLPNYQNTLTGTIKMTNSFLPVSTLNSTWTS